MNAHSIMEPVSFLSIGKVPVSEVTSADVLEILTPLWHRKVATAKRVRQRLRAVLEWAVAMEYRIDNPCDRIGPVLGAQQHVARHMRALPHREVAAAIGTVRGSTELGAAKLAFEFLVLTAARWSEVRWAEWAEIDRSVGVWSIPARRMKANRQHQVPLCGRALEILEAARTLEKGAGVDRDRSGRGLLPEGPTGFDVSDPVDSRHDLPHNQGVTKARMGERLHLC